MVYLRRKPSGEADTISTVGKSFAARSTMLRIMRGHGIIVDFNGASRTGKINRGPSSA